MQSRYRLRITCRSSRNHSHLHRDRRASYVNTWHSSLILEKASHSITCTESSQPSRLGRWRSQRHVNYELPWHRRLSSRYLPAENEATNKTRRKTDLVAESIGAAQWQSDERDHGAGATGRRAWEQPGGSATRISFVHFTRGCKYWGAFNGNINKFATVNCN